MSLGYDYRIDLSVENNSHTQLIRRVPKASEVLEMGCATGYMSEVLKRELGCHVTGVEYDEEAAGRAREHVDELIVADVDSAGWDAPLVGRRFDVVTCADIIEHLKHPLAFLQTLRKYLKTDGKLLVSVPNSAHVAIRLELLEGRLTYEDDGLLDRTHVHFYTHASLAALLRRAGFSIDEFSYTFHDLPDELIGERLARVGLQLTEKALSVFHAPDAVAYQFIVAAGVAESPRADTVVELHDLPLRDSMEVYRNLLAELDATRRVVRARDAEIADYRREIEGYRLTLENYKATLASERRLAGELEFEIAGLHRIQVERDQLAREVRNLGQSLEAVLNSRGWRLWKAATLPIRGARLLRPTLSRALRNPREGFKAAGRLARDLRSGGLAAAAANLRGDASGEPDPHQRHVSEYRDWRRKHEVLSESRLIRIGSDIGAMSSPPLISLLMPVYDTPLDWLREAIDSVLAQSYPHWELCIVDDASPRPGVALLAEEYAEADSRIHFRRRERNGHIVAASNDALQMATGEFIGLLDHDDRLAPHALYHVAMEIRDHEDVGLIYSDEDKIDADGVRFGHYFKPDFNPDLLRSHNMISHFGVYRRSLVVELGGFREGFEGAQDYDLALRMVDRLERGRIRHIPRVLYHWRVSERSTASDMQAKPYALRAAIRAVSDHLKRNALTAEVVESDLFPHTLRVRYALPLNPPRVSIIIPTRNAHGLVKTCIESIREKTTYANYEILLIDNDSDEPESLACFEALEADGVRLLRYPHAFNYSKINNFAVEHARGEVLAFVNNDMEVIAADWLEEMLSLALRPGTGAVGARLWYDDDRLQHGGVVLGLGGVAGHAMKYLPKGHPGYCARALLRQNYTAVTAACMLVRREVFEQVGGFDGEHLAVAFNDVDLCLRIHEAGYDNVWTPWAELYHHESATRGTEDTPEKQRRFGKECAWMERRWAGLLKRDPAYNPNLTLAREDFSLRD